MNNPPIRWSPLVSLTLVVGAAWLAAGSTGLLGFALQRSAVWCCLLAAWAVSSQHLVRAARHLRSRELATELLLAVACLIAGSGVAARQAPVRLTAIAVFALLLGWRTHHRRVRRFHSDVAVAVAVLAIHQLLLYSVPAYWLVSDALANRLGSAAAALFGRKLSIGPTFAGVDFLVLTGVLLGRTLRGAPLMRWFGTAAAVCLAHLTYLGLLVFAPELGSRLGGLVPWNLPLLAAVLHLAVLGWVLRTTGVGISTRGNPGSSERTGPTRPVWLKVLGILALPAAAVALAVVVTLPFGTCSLRGKKVVAHERCYGNWDHPKHGDYGRLSIGMYGMLAPFVESLGGTFRRSTELSAADLDDADVLLLLYPHKPWQPGQLARIERFVRRGGALLLLGEHTSEEEGGGNRFNEVLEPTAIRVPFDSAMFAIGGWLQSYAPFAHPATIGVGDQRNDFGVVIGASVAARWPARPLLVGRWGYNDPGDPRTESKMGNQRYDAGERLGDIVLVAEQELGAGVVVVFGDTSTFTNGITIGTHDFNARLLGYLANRPGSPQVLWRQLLGALLGLGIGALLVWRGTWRDTITVCATLSATLLLCVHSGHRAATLLPDGRGARPNNLAYVDGAHFGRFDDEAWRLDGTMGLKMTLMRNGFLTLELHEFTRERLQRAGLVVSIAPRRRFTAAECAMVREFVAEGGIFVLTSSYHHRAGAEPLLRAFDFAIGPLDPAAPEPQPLSHFKAPYSRFGDYMAYVRFHEGWPVTCAAQEGLQPLAYGADDSTVGYLRYFGKGALVVIGDSCFALNKNLELENGQLFEGARENADFWRWLLSRLRDSQTWTPPRPVVAEAK
ncbi:MAG: hypothetical protein H6837_19075 [Planctomycetes bacterium]|nr:hypothetical protein [Planctomycetota bacterium]